MNEEVDEEKEQEEIKEIDKSKYDPVDEDVADFITPLIPHETEKRMTYSTVKVSMYRFQKDYVDSIQRHLGFKVKSNFMRYAILSFCLEQKKIIDARNQADREFTKAFIKWRKKYLIELNGVKKKIQELKDKAPAQDDGGDPFSADELME